MTEDEENEIGNDGAPDDGVPQTAVSCRMCNIYDPESTHCSLCGVCIEDIDHHCVFFGKCVARKNIDYFTHSICLFLMSVFYFMLLITLDQVWTEQLAPGEPTLHSLATKGEFEHFRSNMTDMQFTVAFEGGTEPPFQNAYWDNHKPGIYKSIATGAPLFSSKDKYDSGTGWPSFSKTLPGAPVLEREDNTFGMSRTEVVCEPDMVHLGHVFNDGPEGKRYCMNSTSLDFIPAEDLTPEEKAKYGF